GVAGGRPAIRAVVEEVLHGAEGIAAETGAGIAPRVRERLPPSVMSVECQLLRVTLSEGSLPGSVRRSLTTAQIVTLSHIRVRTLVGNPVRIVESSIHPEFHPAVAYERRFDHQARGQRTLHAEI